MQARRRRDSGHRGCVSETHGMRFVIGFQRILHDRIMFPMRVADEEDDLAAAHCRNAGPA